MFSVLAERQTYHLDLSGIMPENAWSIPTAELPALAQTSQCLMHTIMSSKIDVCAAKSALENNSTAQCHYIFFTNMLRSSQKKQLFQKLLDSLLNFWGDIPSLPSCWVVNLLRPQEVVTWMCRPWGDINDTMGYGTHMEHIRMWRFP